MGQLHQAYGEVSDYITNTLEPRIWEEINQSDFNREQYSIVMDALVIPELHHGAQGEALPQSVRSNQDDDKLFALPNPEEVHPGTVRRLETLMGYIKRFLEADCLEDWRDEHPWACKGLAGLRQRLNHLRNATEEAING
jgi:hypothetical protein